MPLYLKKTMQQAQLGVWEITEDPGELQRMVSLTPAEQQYYSQLQSETRRRHWLSYRLLIPELLPASLVSGISYDGYGKPHLDNDAGHISVAHSGKFATLIISKTQQAGIDIECIRNKILNLSHKFLTEKEKEYRFPAAVTESLYVIWGAKEALYKLHGKRGIHFAEHLWIEPFAYTGNGKVTGHINNGDTHKVYTLFYETLDDYMMVYTPGA